MEGQSRYTLVGSCVVLLLAAFVLSIVWLVSNREDRDARTYRVYFTHQSLEGLAVKSDVRMRGIRVGSVTAFAFTKARPGTVEVEMRVETAAPMLHSTRADIERNLITGQASVRLTNLTEDSPPLVSEHGQPALVAEGESKIEQFSQRMEKLAEKADTTLTGINELLSGKNREAFAATLQNAQQTSQRLGELTVQAQRSLRTADAAIATGRETIATAGTDFHRLTNEYDKLAATGVSTLQDTAAALKNVTEQTRALGANLDEFLTETEADLRTTSQRLRTTADAVTLGARTLSDPRAAIFGPRAAELGPGEADP